MIGFLISFLLGFAFAFISIFFFSLILNKKQLNKVKNRAKEVESYIKNHTYEQFERDIKNKDTNKEALLTKELLFSVGKINKNMPERVIYKKIRDDFNKIVIMPREKENENG